MRGFRHWQIIKRKVLEQKTGLINVEISRNGPRLVAGSEMRNLIRGRSSYLGLYHSQ